MEEVRIVLIGKTGAGKSDTGNTIIGKGCFESDMTDQSVTISCKAEKTLRNGKQVLVVDTPGMCDTKIENKETLKQIVQCIGLSSPGPHAMILVLSLGSRFTKEEQAAVNELIGQFGEELNKYLIVLFTRGDDLIRKKKTIEKHLENASNELKSLIKNCDNRYIAFDNTNTSDSSQVDRLLMIIDKMVEKNGKAHYTSEMYKKAEERLQAEMEENRRKLNLQKQLELEEIKKTAVANEKERLLKETEAKYAAWQSEEFQRQQVRDKVEKDTGFLNSIWGFVKTTAVVVTSPVWVPAVGIGLLFDNLNKP